MNSSTIFWMVRITAKVRLFFIIMDLFSILDNTDFDGTSDVDEQFPFEQAGGTFGIEEANGNNGNNGNTADFEPSSGTSFANGPASDDTVADGKLFWRAFFKFYLPHLFA